MAGREAFPVSTCQKKTYRAVRFYKGGKSNCNSCVAKHLQFAFAKILKIANLFATKMSTLQICMHARMVARVDEGNLPAISLVKLKLQDE